MNFYDVIIAGTGIGGLYAALQFPKTVSVLLLTKGEGLVSGSSLAQGGIAAVLDHEYDSFEHHYRDTMIAGNHQNDPSAVEQLIFEGAAAVEDIIGLGVDFDARDGELQKTLEGGHSRRRIMHRRDQTGAEIVRTLWARVREKPNVTLKEHTALCVLENSPKAFHARVTNTKTRESEDITASFVLLATGGIGQAYQYTTNPAVATGDGIRLAYKLGAKIKNLHLVQFHPTGFRGESNQEDDRFKSVFLISEAVRGEGARLLNGDGDRFMKRYDQRLELAPRDVVSRAIIEESRRLGGDDRFFLDIRHRDSQWLEERFPTIFAQCKNHEIDMGNDLIPIFPCQHYLMGGIDVDLDGKTTVPRLYAAGECAHTGLHGGNRLASNSLPETLVWGRRAALSILRDLDRGDSAKRSGDTGYRNEDCRLSAADSRLDTEHCQLLTELRWILQKTCFVFADAMAIPTAISRVNEIYGTIESLDDSPENCELKSIALAAKLILEGHHEDTI